MNASKLPAYKSTGAKVTAPAAVKGKVQDPPPIDGQRARPPFHPKSGFNSATSMPVAGEQSPTSEVFANTDGTHTLRLFDHPVQFLLASAIH